MNQRTVQKELFDEFKAPRRRIRQQPYPPSRAHKVLNISYEQFIFVGIAVIMLMVLVFSLGVERGKRLVAQPAAEKVAEQLKPVAVAQEPKPEPEAAKPATGVGVISLERVDAEKPKVPAPPPAESGAARVRKNTNIFTLQIVAYRSKKTAQKEINKLSEKGFDPFIITEGGYYQICVGEYRNKDELKKRLGELQKNYKGSFIRKR